MLQVLLEKKLNIGNNIKVQSDSNGPDVNLDFKVNTYLKKINVQITDSNGSVVYSGSFSNINYGENQFKIPLSNVHEGQVLHVTYSGIDDQNQIVTDSEKLALISTGNVEKVNINQEEKKQERIFGNRLISIDDILSIET